MVKSIFKNLRLCGVAKSIVFLLIFIFFVVPGFSLDVPKLTSPIMDNANVIDSSTKSELNELLLNLSNETGIQVAVLTIPSLEGEALESYSMKVAEDWKLGQKDLDNGVLLLVSVGDKDLRIETGYGVEGDLTDTKSGLIIRNVIIPHFKDNDYSEGISQGVKAIVQNVTEDFTGESGEIIDIESEDGSIPIAILGFLFIFVFAIISNKKNGVRNVSSGGETVKNILATKAVVDIAKSIISNDNNGFGGFGGGFGGFSGGGGSFGGGGASGSW